MKSAEMYFQLLALSVACAAFNVGCEQSYSISAHDGGRTVEALPVTGPVTTPTPNCRPTLDTTTANLRIMFMVDNSGSTAGNDGTDPDFRYRARAVEDFLVQYSAKTNFTYSFGYFNGAVARLYDTGSRSFKKASAQAPFGTAAQLAGALALYRRQTPNDETPYKAAFNAIRNQVIADKLANGGRYRYVLIFMSDGQPTDLDQPLQANIRNLVLELKDAAGTQNPLTVSAVYFGADDDNASIRNLSFMASDGNGQFVNTNHTTRFSIDDVITVPGAPACN